MLRYLRENTGNWIIKIFLGIIVIVFVFLGVGSIGSKRKNTVATVDDEPITIKEFQQAYKNQIEQLQAQFGKNLNDDLIKAFNVKQMVLDQLIEQRLLLKEAERFEIRVSDREIQDLIMSIKAFEKDGFFDLDTYRSVLSRNGISPEGFEENQTLALKQQKLRNMVTSAVLVSDPEAEAFYIYQNTKMAVDYIHLSPESYKEITASPEQIASFYETNKDNYLSKAKRKAAYIKFSPDDYKDQINIPDKAVKDYYEQNIVDFETPEKVEARHILIRLDPEADALTVAAAENKAREIYEKAVSGEDFEKLAREFSEGPSKSSGGYLGTFEYKNMVKPFADAAFAMNPGDISEPVKTQFGLHIIKLIARFEATTQPFEEAADTIREKLVKENLGYIAYDKAGEAFDAVIDGDDFEQVALIAKKKIKHTDAFDISGNGLVFPAANQFAQAAFALDSDEISDVRQFGESYYLIKVTQLIEPSVQPLAAVKDTVEKDVTQKLRREKANKDADALLEKAVAGSALEQLNLPDGATVMTSALFTRNGRIEGIENSEKIVEAGFTLSADNKLYPQVIETDKGYYLIALNQINVPDDKMVAENLKSIKNELTWKKQSEAYQAWLDELKQKSTIELNTQILN